MIGELIVGSIVYASYYKKDECLVGNEWILIRYKGVSFTEPLRYKPVDITYELLQKLGFRKIRKTWKKENFGVLLPNKSYPEGAIFWQSKFIRKANIPIHRLQNLFYELSDKKL